MPGIVEPLDEPVTKFLWDLHTYWRSKRGQAFAPPWSAISPAEMKPWLNYLALVDVVGDEPRFRSRLFSTGLVRAYGTDITGRWMHECDLNFVLFRSDRADGARGQGEAAEHPSSPLHQTD
jgi:hypothetical protein